MNFMEVIHEILMRPGMLAVLPGRKALWLRNSGQVMDAMLKGTTYARLSVQDILATTWIYLSVEQLEHYNDGKVE